MINLKTPAKEVGFTHEDFAALLDKYDYHFSPGDIVAGTVFSLEPRGALIDIGAKTAAYIPIQEMSINRVESPEEVLQSNETREFFILTDENEDGQLTLSIRRIEYMRAWERVRQLKAEDATVRSPVFATNRGGALVRIEGLRGFIPGSHISTRKPKEDLLNEELPLKFLEVDEERNRLVLSHRRALVERKMNRLEVGEVVIGAVRGIKPYGAFIDIGGVSGLLHISEISHDHIETPSSVLKVNDELKVMIIDLDADRGRISLSTKQLEPEPGAMVKNPQLVYDQAEEMAAKFREKLIAAQRGETIEETAVEAPEVEAATETVETPEVEAATETAVEAPEVEATTETVEAPEVEATTEAVETPEVEAATETAVEAPEVEAATETAVEAPEVEATTETVEVPEVEATTETVAAPEEKEVGVTQEEEAVESKTEETTVETDTSAVG